MIKEYPKFFFAFSKDFCLLIKHWKSEAYLTLVLKVGHIALFKRKIPRYFQIPGHSFPFFIHMPFLRFFHAKIKQIGALHTYFAVYAPKQTNKSHISQKKSRRQICGFETLHNLFEFNCSYWFWSNFITYS